MLQAQFNLDEDDLEALKDELIDGATRGGGPRRQDAGVDRGRAGAEQQRSEDTRASTRSDQSSSSSADCAQSPGRPNAGSSR